MNWQHSTPDLNDLTYVAADQTMNAMCRSVEGFDKLLAAAKAK